MKIIALYNMKGGVGKTAGCVNLAYLAAREGKNVLVWDLDPQGSAGFYLNEDAAFKGSLKKLLTQEYNAADYVYHTEYENLYLLPASFANRHLDTLLDEMKQAKKRMKAIAQSFKNDYDYLFIDCPPGIGVLSEAIFSFANIVLSPTIPTTLSIRTFSMANNFFSENNIAIEKLHCYFSMVDSRKSMHNLILEEYYNHPRFLKTYIPNLSAIEKMGEKMAPVTAFAPSSYAAQCFTELWREIAER